MGRLWEGELREHFPVTQSWAYLNSATAGPVTREAARAGAGVYESMLAHGDADWEQMLAGLNEARRQLALITGCDPEELAFTRNTSHSASLAAQMLWEAGHRKAVAFEDEFPASTIPFLSRGFDLRFVRAVDGQCSSRVRSCIGPGLCSIRCGWDGLRRSRERASCSA
jgi:selenocysteine lyase/cysteine desulfurase